MTANCRRILSADHSASNGVVHLVSDLLQPVTQSVADIISSHPQLTQFAQRQFYISTFVVVVIPGTHSVHNSHVTSVIIAVVVGLIVD